MSEPAGLQHPLGIEAVHWSAGTGTDVIVRVAGRWRRRRAATTVPAVLAIDTEHQRHRFPALPEPPSVRAAQPGLWQVTFRIPASLAPYLAGKVTLMLGSVSIVLPPAVADPGARDVAGRARAVADPDLLADRRERRAELAEREARRRAAEAEAATGEARALLDRLELELREARRESERLRDEVDRAERKRREAEQLAHSEWAMRLDLGRDHAVRIRRRQAEARAVLELLEAAQTHAEELGREIERLRASAVESAGPRPGSERRARALAAELALAESTPVAPVATARLAAAGEPPGLALELAMHACREGPRGRGPGTISGSADAVTGDSESRLAGALLHLAAERADGEDTLQRAPTADHIQAEYVTEAIEAIARQLDALRTVVALLPAAAADELGRATRRVNRPTAARPTPPGEPPGAVAPDRLAAALSRLREEHPLPEGRGSPVGLESPGAAESPGAEEWPGASESSAAARPAAAPTLGAELAAARAARRSAGSGVRPAVPAPGAGSPAGKPLAPAHPAAVAGRQHAEPAPPAAAASAGPGAPAPRGPAPAAPRTSRWLLPALKRLLREDPALVGNLVIRLVPAQCLVVVGPVSYDIALTGAGSLAVTVKDDRVRLDVLGAPRPLGEVDFRIEGDLEALGRLVIYGRLRRRISRRVARVRGDRSAFAVLAALVREPLGLHELHAAGLRLDPELTLRLVASMVDPSWSAGERFTVGHESPDGGRVYLSVRDGERPRVSRQPPLGPVGSTIRCSDERLLALLAGGSEVEIPVRGADAPVALVRDWIARAQRES